MIVNTKDTEAKSVWAKPFERKIEYEMSKEMAKQLLNARKGNERNIPAQQYLCQIVNEEFGVLGNCTHVITI